MNRDAFYATVTVKLGGISDLQKAGFDAILDVIAGAPLAHQAYMLATPWHETNRTMQPVREAYWLSEDWRKTHLRYYPWYGRGYVQLTWQTGYKRADDELGLGGELLKNPDLAMRPDIAAKVMQRGMTEGWFTGVKLSTVLPMSGVATADQYTNARTIINGHDRAALIETYAQAFERALRDGGIQ